MLSNAYFLAKFRFDTAENEPAKNLQKFANFPNFANPNGASELGSTLSSIARSGTNFDDPSIPISFGSRNTVFGPDSTRTSEEHSKNWSMRYYGLQK